jgi:glycosyltransferase involved in cell wall biosynthesis
MKVLFVIPRLDHCGSVHQLRMLAANLPRDRFECCLCVLGPEGLGTEELRKAGISVESLGWQRWLDLGALRRLRQLVRSFRPDVIHAWQPPALRAVGLGGGNGVRLLFSAPLSPVRRPTIHQWDRWLLRRVERVIVSGPAQADRCRRAGVSAEKLVAIPPAVEIEPSLERKTIPVDWDCKARCLACVGPLQARKGFRDAIWAFDILRYVADGLHLLLIGDGPEVYRLRQFIHITQTADRIHLLGAREDVPAWLKCAQIVWVPSRTPAGVNVALEAMAAGRPVVASHLPELAEVVLDGQTGLLVPPGDKMALARQTRLLLENAELRQRLGEAARQRAARHFARDDLVRRFTDLYENQKG